MLMACVSKKKSYAIYPKEEGGNRLVDTVEPEDSHLFSETKPEQNTIT
jgi:hypothetical protein